MAIDCQKMKEDYDSYAFEQKRDLVVSILEGFSGKDPIFDEIRQFVTTTQNLPPAQLDEIFLTVLSTLYQDGQDKLMEAGTKLEAIKKKMLEAKAQEEREKQQEDPSEMLALL